MEIQNWDGTQNCVMLGYIMRAVNEWNEQYPDDQIDRATIDKLTCALKWAWDDMTATEAYRYYMTH
ncbi:MAG: hypothetical protein J6U86_04485 [Clostridia bacterium]|nr:hypothetical protein [Clostridia bacterium]